MPVSFRENCITCAVSANEYFSLFRMRSGFRRSIICSKTFRIAPIGAARKLSEDFNLALFETKRSKAKCRKIAQAAAEREELKALAEDFEAWDYAYYDYLCEQIWYWEMVQHITAPRFPSDTWKKDLWKRANNELPWLVYLRDILFGGSIDEKIELYMNTKEAFRF